MLVLGSGGSRACIILQTFYEYYVIWCPTLEIECGFKTELSILRIFLTHFIKENNRKKPDRNQPRVVFISLAATTMVRRS